MACDSILQAEWSMNVHHHTFQSSTLRHHYCISIVMKKKFNQVLVFLMLCIVLAFTEPSISKDILPLLDFISALWVLKEVSANKLLPILTFYLKCLLISQSPYNKSINLFLRVRVMFRDFHFSGRRQKVFAYIHFHF